MSPHNTRNGAKSSEAKPPVIRTIMKMKTRYQGDKIPPTTPIFYSRTFRKIIPGEYEFGINAYGEDCTRLFVFEERNHSLIREYAKYVRDKWYCLGCRLQPHRKMNNGRLEGQTFYAPASHLCSALSYEEAMIKQDKIKNKINGTPEIPRHGSCSIDDESNGNGNHEEGEYIGIVGEEVIDVVKDEIMDEKPEIISEFSVEKESSASSETSSPRSSPSIPAISRPVTVLTPTNYRSVPSNQFKYGLSGDGVPNMRLIVNEPNTLFYVREYGNTLGKWYCLGCNKLDKTRKFAQFENGILQVPLNHLCNPYSRMEVEARQKTFENRRMSQKRGPKTIKSPLIVYRGAVPPPPKFAGGITAIRKLPKMAASVNDVISSINGIFDKPKSASSNRPFVVEMHDEDDDDHETSPSPLDQQPSSSASSSKTINFPAIESEHPQIPVVSTFAFNNPSKLWLKTVCEMLKLPYNHEAYQLWATIDIDRINTDSKPGNTRIISAGNDSGFRALSLLLTGKEDSPIKKAVNQFFYKNFKKLGICFGTNFNKLTHDDDFIFQTLFADEMTPIHCNAITILLNCRIGVFVENKLVKYGDWEKDDGKVTLLFDFTSKCYNIVTSLDN